jgi:hypothetical protein
MFIAIETDMCLKKIAEVLVILIITNTSAIFFKMKNN